MQPAIDILHLNQGVEYFYRNDFATALVEFDQSLALRESECARWNRAQMLLALGRYPEGFADYAVRPTALGGLPRWHGEDDKPVLLQHECGFGDTVMLLRYLRMAKARTPAVMLFMPPPLARLAAALAPVVEDIPRDCYACPFFDLMSILEQTTTSIPPPPYLWPDAKLRKAWASKIGNGYRRHRIGICWSTTSATPYRSMELAQFIELLRDVREGDLYSLQAHDDDEARANDVHVMDFADFADVAAIASLMDEIVSIDTAALHVAGAIGHPNVHAILPYPMCWRWLNGNPWYPQIQLHQQTTPGDWLSAFEH